MKIIKLLALPILLLFIVGCDTLLHLTPEAKIRSIYDPRSVLINPHGTEYNGGLGTGVGATWIEHTDKVGLIIEFYGVFTEITGAELNIDGRKLALTPFDLPTDARVNSGIIKSTKGFMTDLATIKKILHSKSTWLRVETATESRENAIIDEGKGSEAYNGLVMFMKAVEEK